MGEQIVLQESKRRFAIYFWKTYDFQHYLLRFNLQCLTNSQTFKQNQTRSPAYFSTDVRCFDFGLFVQKRHHYFFKYVKGSTKFFPAYSV